MAWLVLITHQTQAAKKVLRLVLPKDHRDGAPSIFVRRGGEMCGKAGRRLWA